APVSGGQAGAVNGQLTVMCGGDAAPFERAQPVAMAFAKAVTLVGASGAGQLAKMVNQICVAGLVQGLSEGINFGVAAGLDMKLVLQVIGKGAAQSWQMDNRGTTMIDDKFDFGFAVDWMRKDLGLCLDEARTNGAPLPVAALVDQFYADVQARGGGRWDTSSLVRRLRRAKAWVSMDAAAFDRALAEARPVLLRIARLQLRNDAVAEDVVSETLIAALEGRDRFSGQSQVRTWLVGILKHKIIDHFRRGQRDISIDAL